MPSISCPIDLPCEYFFDDAPEELKGMQALAEQEQEDRDFAAALQRAGRAAITGTIGSGRR
jgi:hypothetical protein